MPPLPIIDEKIIEPQQPVPGTFNGNRRVSPADVSRVTKGDRHFRVFAAHAGFEILPTIERVADYCIDPNIFFSPRFCVPAMPRLGERIVRLMLLQDGQNEDSETRFLMPFTVEKAAFGIRPAFIRSWSTPYGPLGTPLVERREASNAIEDLFATIASPAVPLPKIIAFPDVMADSAVVSLIRSVALANGLPIAMTRKVQRPVLDATRDSDTYLTEALGSHHRRDLGRQWRKLEKEGALEYVVARNIADVRTAMEEFLLLENAGWKGAQRSSLASDKLRGAFAREAVNGLAALDKCRIHALTLDGKIIASLIVFVENGRAWTWKTTYDEKLSAFSPGKLLMTRVTESLLDDPNIDFADSCAIEGHPMMGQLWQERREMTTLVVGLSVELDRDVRRVASQMDLYTSTRQTAKDIIRRLKKIIRLR